MKKLFTLLFNFFRCEPDESELSPNLDDLSTEFDGWILLSPYNIPDEVVLLACDTSDCGWTFDTGYYNRDKKQWYASGTLKSAKLHLPYTHFRELPKPPIKHTIRFEKEYYL